MKPKVEKGTLLSARLVSLIHFIVRKLLEILRHTLIFIVVVLLLLDLVCLILLVMGTVSHCHQMAAWQ